MFKIIFKMPFYIWPLFGYLLWNGLRARKIKTVPWSSLIAIPAIILIWSIRSIFAFYSISLISLWGISLFIGIWLGTLTVRKLKLRFDKQKKLIEIPGSWVPMIFFVSIFSLRYFLKATYGLNPELIGNKIFLCIENVAIIVSGMFVGRLLGFWQKAKICPHVDLTL